MDDTNDLHAFREGFCEKAAELGVLPSELLMYKQSGLTDFIPSAKDLVGAAKDLGWAGVVGGLLGGGTAGALGSYLYNKAKFEIDPEDSILPDYGAVDEAKRLHLLAKYRNAAKLLRSGGA